MEPWYGGACRYGKGRCQEADGGNGHQIWGAGGSCEDIE